MPTAFADLFIFNVYPSTLSMAQIVVLLSVVDFSFVTWTSLLLRDMIHGCEKG